MANTKISALPTATTVGGSDLIPIVQSGVTKQATHDLLPLSAAQTAALSATYVAIPPSTPAAILQDAGLYAAGDSYLAIDAQNTPGKRYIDQLTTAFGMTPINVAAGGNYMQDIANAMVHGSTPAPGAAAPSATPRYLLEGGLNDLMHNDVDPGTRDNFATALEAAIWLACAQPTRIEDSDARWTYTGSWTNYSDAATSAGTAHISDQGPATDRATITPGAGDYVLMSVGIAAGQGAVFQTGAVSVAGTQIGGNIIQVASTTVNASTQLNVPIPVLGVRDGQLLTVSAAGGGYTFIDCLLKLNDIAPWIIVMKPAYIPNASAAAVDLYRAAIDRTVAKVSVLYPPLAGKIITVDPVTMGWDKTVHVGADGIHPNDAGEDLIYSCITSRVGSAMARRNSLIDSGLAS